MWDRHIAKNPKCEAAERERISRQEELVHESNRARRDDVISQAAAAAVAVAAAPISPSPDHQDDSWHFPPPREVDQRYVRVSPVPPPYQDAIVFTQAQSRTQSGRANTLPIRYRQAVPSPEDSEPPAALDILPTSAPPSVNQSQTQRYRTPVNLFNRYRIYPRQPDQPQNPASESDEQILKEKAVC